MLRLFRKAPPKWLSEERLFKSDFRMYCVRRMGDGSMELWAHDTREIRSTYLGRVLGGRLERPENFYTLQWIVQKGAQKMYGMLDI